ncbi:cell division protein FtsQ/DivIB [Nannocystaceae bacterium ST9]
MRASRAVSRPQQAPRKAARPAGRFAFGRNSGEATRISNRRKVVISHDSSDATPSRRAQAKPESPARVPLREREWPRKLGRAGLRLGLVVGVAWALLAGGREVYEYATTSSRFEVQHLVFEPTEHVDDETLRELLAIDPATNILSLDLDALSQRLTEHPWVAQASVTRNLPDTLAVEIVEHEAAAIVLAGRFYLVDEQGVPFKQLERGERDELPIITGIERDSLRDPAARDRAVATIARGLEVLRLYQSKQRPRLGEVHLADDGSIVLYTANTGTQLHLGRDEYEQRLARWDALRVALGERAERLAIVHLDHESKPDRRDRVVARFVSEQDEAVLLAEAAQADLADHAGDEANGESESRARSSGTSPTRASKPAARAGQRNRIPRYE